MAATTPAERKALLFLALVGVLGAGVKGWRARTASGDAVGAQPALERQLVSAERAARERRAWKEAGRAKARRQKAGMADRKAAAVRPPRGDSARRRPRPAGAAGAPPAMAGPVDLERADSAALDGLPGVGPALAARIVRHRDSVGRLGGAAGLDAVPGVGPALLRRLAPLVTFGGRRGG